MKSLIFVIIYSATIFIAGFFLGKSLAIDNDYPLPVRTTNISVHDMVEEWYRENDPHSPGYTRPEGGGINILPGQTIIVEFAIPISSLIDSANTDAQIEVLKELP